MTGLFLLPFIAGILSALLAVAGLLHRKRSLAAWCFFAGMMILGVKSILTGVRLRAYPVDVMLSWLTREILIEALLPAVWLCFSLTYSRTNYREFLKRWKLPLIIAAVLPIGLAFGFSDRLYQVVQLGTFGETPALQIGEITKALHVILLLPFVTILMNLEQTFRSAVGTMRWRIKFVVLAVGVIFGARLYIQIQAILFPGSEVVLWNVESGALLIGCVFLIVAYLRTRLVEIDLYPSVAVLRSSLTILIVGVYLLVVGGLAQVAQRFGGTEIFEWQAIVVLAGMAGLALLLLSDRARQTIHVFVVRHFSKAKHDSAGIWTMCSEQFSRVKDQAGLCEAAAKLISETFDVLSVTVWLLDDDQRLMVRASTARQSPVAAGDTAQETASRGAVDGLQAMSAPFDLETAGDAWAEELRQLNSANFTEGGHRLCVPLRTGDRTVGVLVLADRINAAVYTVEELELLKCVADQMTSVLMNHRLASEVAQARELEAFRTMSLFFVHDLKNAAASLNLMLRNLPVHFNDPAFREDALRGIGNTARRIDDMIARLSALKDSPKLSPARADLNEVVSDALNRVDGSSTVQLTRELQPLPAILVDREQIQNVVTNLVLNARDALGEDGRIDVRTEHRDGRVLLSVSDNGCGMDQAFVKDSLFRPFQSTKKKGLGIGLFQSRAIVQAHGGAIHVQTEVGRGTTFSISLPVAAEK